MEKILNDEEKIRRAEEIYFRRNNQVIPIKRKEDRKNKNLKDKILLNLLVMFNLAVIVFCVQNSSIIFKDEFIDLLNNYNNETISKIINVFSTFIKDGNLKEENIEITKENIEDINVNTVENNEVEEQINKESIVSSINEMELDVKNLKAAYEFVSPLNKGSVSSNFGARESKYQNVSGYHTGIDIAAEQGTTIVAAMEGIVELVSKEGDYGNHIKIRCNNVYTLYAHCSKIFVKEGQIVGRGQKIATVGNTGNSTGAHLHFEIRVDDRFVNPAKVIEFKL